VALARHPIRRCNLRKDPSAVLPGATEMENLNLVGVFKPLIAPLRFTIDSALQAGRAGYELSNPFSLKRFAEN
jgi:hypothetical protein